MFSLQVIFNECVRCSQVLRWRLNCGAARRKIGLETPTVVTSIIASYFLSYYHCLFHLPHTVSTPASQLGLYQVTIYLTSTGAYRSCAALFDISNPSNYLVKSSLVRLVLVLFGLVDFCLVWFGLVKFASVNFF